MVLQYAVHQRINTEYPADTVEYCDDILALGTYKLVEATHNTPANRVGRIHLFQFNRGHSMNEIYRNDTSAILDCSWSPISDKGDKMLVMAGSDGNMPMIRLKAHQDVPISERIEFINNDGIFERDILCLTVDWSRIRKDMIFCSLFDGNVAVVKLNESGLICEQKWRANPFEPWASSLDRHDVNCAYSGGEDCELKMWDLRSQVSSLKNKWHSMGVTCIQGHPTDAHVIASGSYDEHLALWDKRNFKRPLLSKKIGGGIWRIKWNPKLPEYVLTANMYEGFKLIKITKEISMECNYIEHSSIGYGIDWTCGNSKHNTDSTLFSVASCSFYDNLLTFWNVK